MSDRVVLGIDLGTTYSCVAHLDEYGKPTVLFNADNKPTTPSVVYFEDAANAVVGEQAKNELARNPDHVIREIKRHMGEEGYYRTIDGRDWYPAQVSSLILRSIVDDALDQLDVEPPDDGPVADAVITVPAYFDMAARAATHQAGELAGLNVLSIINEPTAAAIAYGMTSQGDPRTVLVYDLGGGTFDATVIKVSPDRIAAVATGGDRHLGGVDWDERLIQLFVERFQEFKPEAGDPSDDKEAMGELELKAEAVKQGLSYKNTYGTSLVANLQRVQFDVSRDELEKLTDPLIQQTLDYTDLVLENAAKKGVSTIDEVILVGGMSKMPMIAQRLGEHLRPRFPDLPEPKLHDPDQIVAKGAALFAVSRVSEAADEEDPINGVPSSFLTGPAPIPVITNITSKSYGVRAVRHQDDHEGFISFIIDQNDELPVDKTERFRTVYDGQVEVEVKVFEQATDVPDENVDANTECVAGTLGPLPPKQPAGQPVDVTFRLDDEGILHILAESHGRSLSLDYTIPGQTPESELIKPLPVLMK